jgi:integrase
MARIIRNAKLDSRPAREHLTVRREPYWIKLGKGRALGYRKIATGRGSWIAKHRHESGERRIQALGGADDSMDADGIEILTYEQATRLAYSFFAKAARLAAGHGETNEEATLTVSRAVDEYIEWRKHKGGQGSKGVEGDRTSMESLVLPFRLTADRKNARTLGELPVEKLTKAHFDALLKHLAAMPARKRTALGSEQQYRETPTDEDQVRARRASANRVWAILRAALNYAADNHEISDAAWRRIKPFGGTATARPRFLNEEETKRLINACAPDFRQLAKAALLTGCRYGELCRLEYGDFDPDSATVFVRTSKSGKPRHVALTTEGVELFTQLRHRSRPGGLLLTKANGAPWTKSGQQRPIAAAYGAANIAKANFHALRHTYASRLIKGGAHLKYVAEQLGHATTLMVEKHYGHLAKSDVKRVVQDAFGELGVIDADNVRTLKIPG